MKWFINNIEIQGIIGFVKESEFSGKFIYDFSVCTESRYPVNGNWILDTVWHHVKYWSDTKLSLEKGKWVHVDGHVKINKYMDSSGNNKTIPYIYAISLKLLETEIKRNNE